MQSTFTEKLIVAQKPFWLIGLGAGAGLLVLAVLLLIWTLVHRRSAVVVLDTLLERSVAPIWILACFLAASTLFISLLDIAMPTVRFFERKQEAITSVFRIPFAGEREFTVVVPPGAKNQEVPIGVPEGEMKTVDLESTDRLLIAINQKMTEKTPSNQRVKLAGRSPYHWARMRESVGRFAGKIDTLYLTNETANAQTLTLKIVTQPVIPEVRIVPWVAFGMLAILAFYVLLRFAFPKVTAVMMTTAKETISQPLFPLVMVFTTGAIICFVFIPYNTFGDDIKMLKDTGMVWMMVLALLVAMWSASRSVSEEIEGRTALTVLSKPIGRAQFLIGKFLGICSATSLIFIIVGTVFLFCISFKVLYDARESGLGEVFWQQCYREVVLTVPGIFLAFLETAVIASISVAISTRLPMLPNLIICFTIYALGNLVPLFVRSTTDALEPVRFVANLFAAVLPMLEYFSVYAAIAGGYEVPLVYLFWVTVYTVIFCSCAMLVALTMFVDRDLA